jgi:hypothetical protein
VGPPGRCLSFCTSGFPAPLDVGLLKGFCSEKLVRMASAQIDETDGDRDEVLDGYAESTRQVSVRQSRPERYAGQLASPCGGSQWNRVEAVTYAVAVCPSVTPRARPFRPLGHLTPSTPFAGLLSLVRGGSWTISWIGPPCPTKFRPLSISSDVVGWKTAGRRLWVSIGVNYGRFIIHFLGLIHK